MKEKKIDKFFLIIVLILITGGLAMFVSASLGILNRNEAMFYAVLRSQLILGLGCGLVAMYLALKVNYKTWSKYSFYIFLGAILLTAAVFIPGLGYTHLGARRWIEIGSIS
ncbi:MAG: FtsW/RodA/SpoVE family cell cycle protein, partial [Candidatus Paceibacterota bacterium]